VTTCREFQDELERLHQQAEMARRKEKGEALARIRELIIEYQLLPSDLGLGPVSKAPRSTTTTVKYRDPATGATWSGRGRAPGWLQGEDRSKFAVEQ
jgi:DNA-binding protein H-NS